MAEVAELSRVEVSEKGLIKASDKLSLKVLSQKHNEVNYRIAQVMQNTVDTEDELKDIREQMREKTRDLNKRKKELRDNLKNLSEQRLLLLGECKSYQSQLKALGFELKKVDIKEIIQSSPKQLKERRK